MTDCTPTSRRRSRLHLAPWLAAALSTLMLAPSGVALADGDPASDVLATQSLFLPQDAGVPPNQQAQLALTLAAAQRRGYPIRVAIIASPTDLGSVTELWRQPQQYARFLGQELSLAYRGPLLVVMPDGYGVSAAGGSAASAQAALAGVPSAGAFGGDAITAIRRLASAHGTSLPVSGVTASRRFGGSDSVAWLVFALGGAAIAFAWTASLRARPPRVRGSEVTPT